MKRIVFAVALALITTNLHAFTVTLTHDGANGVIADIQGTGTVTQAGNQLFFDNLTGDPFQPSLDNTDVSLATPIPFQGSLAIDSLLFDHDGGAGTDDFALRVPTNPIPIGSYNISGSALLVGLLFSDLNVGTYSGVESNVAFSALAGDLTLIINDIAPVPLPAAAWLFISAMCGLFGIKRLKAA